MTATDRNDNERSQRQREIAAIEVEELRIVKVQGAVERWEATCLR